MLSTTTAVALVPRLNVNVPPARVAVAVGVAVRLPSDVCNPFNAVTNGVMLVVVCTTVPLATGVAVDRLVP